MSTMQSWDKWFYDSYTKGQNSPPPVSSNNGMINPAPNTSQQNFASPPTTPVVTQPKAPTTYIPKTPSVPSAVPSAVAISTPTPLNPLVPPPMTANPQGLSIQGMGQLAEQQMRDRVIGASQANPMTLQTGAQMGKLADGTPQTFQAYTYGQPVGTPMSGSVPAGIPAGVPAGGTGEAGASMGDDSNKSISIRLFGASNYATHIANLAWQTYDANATADENSGTVSSKSATGFVLTCSTYVAAADVQYTAYSE